MMDATEEKKIKRAAANVNERRRMQNINCGFEALRDLIDVPNKSKLSKSAILRHSVELLRNVLSENQQLREQNAFLRELHGQTRTSPAETTLSRKSESVCSLSPSYSTSVYRHSAVTSSPSKSGKRVRMDLSALHYDNNNTPQKTFDPYQYHSLRKSPRRNIAMNKITSPVSPKLTNRSSVITENYCLINSYPILESPTRRSLRLQAKEKQMLTPPSSMDTSLDNIEDIKKDIMTTTFNESPSSYALRHLNSSTNRSTKILHTPEKNIQPKSARRSLDVIIQAIDQLEKS